jgi:hypothetical protein
VSQATTQSRPPLGDRALRAIGRLATRLLGHRLFPAIGAGIAILVALPTLDDGLLWDDFVLLQALSRSPDLLHALVHTYVFVMPDSVAELKEIGTLPWWALDDMRWAFFRPVSSLTLWIDHRLWPDSPALMHAQSIAWFGLVAFAVGLLYRRLAGVAWAGGLALVFFVLDDSHAYPVAWLALRNGVVSSSGSRPRRICSRTPSASTTARREREPPACSPTSPSSLCGGSRGARWGSGSKAAGTTRIPSTSPSASSSA